MVITISYINVSILKIGQAIKKHRAVYHMNVHGSTTFMMNSVMSLLSVKYAKKRKSILGGRTEVKHVQGMSVGVLIIMLALRTGKTAQSMLGSIKTIGIATMHL